MEEYPRYENNIIFPDQSLNDKPSVFKKPVIIITARVHPG